MPQIPGKSAQAWASSVCLLLNKADLMCNLCYLSLYSHCSKFERECEWESVMSVFFHHSPFPAHTILLTHRRWKAMINGSQMEEALWMARDAHFVAHNNRIEWVCDAIVYILCVKCPWKADRVKWIYMCHMLSSEEEWGRVRCEKYEENESRLKLCLAICLFG